MAFEDIHSLPDVRKLNQGFLNQVKSGGEGITKAANLINEEIILTILREDGVNRRVLPPRPITPDELWTDPENPDTPAKLVGVEQQMGEYLALQVDFMQGTKDLWFRSNVARVYFKPIKTKTIRLHEGQILASNYPIRSYVESVARNDILVVEDLMLVAALDRCVVRTNAQFAAAYPGLDHRDIADTKKVAINNRQQTGTVLLHEARFEDVGKWEHGVVGSYVMQEIIEKGAKGEDLKYKSWMGIKWIMTNNSDVIMQNHAYFLPASQKFLGVSYVLSEAEQWIEFRDGVLSTNTREIIGRAILNPLGITRLNCQ